MILICDGLVSVRRTCVSSKKKVARCERAGCVGSNASLSKLYSTVSTSLSSRTSYPRPMNTSSIARRVCVIGCRWPTGSSSPGSVTSTTSSRRRRSSSSSASERSRSSAAASRRCRIPFRSIPVSRSRTPRRARASSLLRPRKRTRASSIASALDADAIAGAASSSCACQFTAARLSKAPPLFARRDGVRPRCERRTSGDVPGCAPGPRKQRRRLRHAWKHSAVSAYDSPYDKIARLYDPWSASVTEDVTFYVEHGRRAGRVLELGVGTGRIAVPTAAAGVAVVGVDSSPGMLEVAREQAELAGVEVDLRLGDMRDPPVDGTFPLVTIPFRSLLHMETDGDRRATLRAVRRLLEPGGRFVFDVFAPAADDIAATDGRWLEREPGIWERADWNERTRTLILRLRGPAAESEMSLAWLSVPEWRGLLGEEGFDVEALYGWFNGK